MWQSEQQMANICAKRGKAKGKQITLVPAQFYLGQVYLFRNVATLLIVTPELTSEHI